MKKVSLIIFLSQIFVILTLLSNLLALESSPDSENYLTAGVYNSNPKLSSARLVVDENGNGEFGDTGDLVFLFPPNSYSDWKFANLADINKNGLFIVYHESHPGSLVIDDIDDY